jgi:hypothetical protein
MHLGYQVGYQVAPKFNWLNSLKARYLSALKYQRQSVSSARQCGLRLTPHLPKTRPQFTHKQFRLLKRREVSTLIQFVPIN